MNRAAREAALLAVTAAGPVAMHLQRFDVSVPLAILGAAGAVGATAALGEARWRERLAAAAVAGAPVALAGAPFAGAWLAAAAVLATWAGRGWAPHPRLRAPHPSAAVPLLLALAGTALRSDITADRLGPAPFVLVAGIGLVLLATSADRARDAVMAGSAVALVGAASAAGGHTYRVTTSVGGALLTAAVVIAHAASGDRPDQRWRPVARLGPLLLAAPGVLWWMVDVGILVDGHLRSDQVWYRAWRTSLSALPTEAITRLAWTGTPALVAALLGIGAHLSLTGRAGAVRVAVLTAAATATAVLVAVVWQVGAPALPPI